MPADLTREEIERLRVDFDRGHDLGYGDQRALLAHALAEPARLAAARAEGVREGIETIITIAESDQRWRPGSLWDVLQREVAGRALSPAPAEPSAPEDVPGTAAGWMDTARHYAEGSEYYQSLLDQIGQMFGPAAYTSDDGSVQDSVLRAKVPELVAARIAALEAENAKLRRELEPLAREAERYDPPEGDGTENLSEAWDSRFTIGHLRRARALLRGGADA